MALAGRLMRVAHARAQASPAVVSHTAAQSTNGTTVTSSGITTTGATLILAVVSAGGTPTFSDSESNTWQSQAVSGARMFYCWAPTVGSGHTFSAAGSFPSLAMIAFSGITSGASPDVNEHASGSSGTIQPGSATPAANGELVATGCGFQQNVTVAVNESFAITDQLPLVSGKAYGVAIAWQVQATAAALDPSWTGTGISGAASMLAFHH